MFGVGYHAYWPQFEGLLDELLGKLATFVRLVVAPAVALVLAASLGLRLVTVLTVERPEWPYGVNDEAVYSIDAPSLLRCNSLAIAY